MVKKISKYFDRHFNGVLISPTVVILLLITVLPFLYMIFISFTKLDLFSGETRFVGFNNFITLFNDPDTLKSWVVTFVFVTVALVIEIFFGMVTAMVLNNPKLRGTKIITTALIAPSLCAPLIGGLMWLFLFNNEGGILPYYLRRLGLLGTASILGSAKTALWAVILVDIWQWTPLVILILFSGLQSLDETPFEAANIDGASKWQQIKYITIPLLKPVLTVILLLRMMDLFRLFDPIYVMTRGGPALSTEVISLHIYRVAFSFFDFGMAAAMSLGIIFVVTIISQRFTKFSQSQEEVDS